jgi:hypothetical protein
VGDIEREREREREKGEWSSSRHKTLSIVTLLGSDIMETERKIEHSCIRPYITLYTLALIRSEMLRRI